MDAHLVRRPVAHAERAALLFWNDFSGLEQALAVARARRDEVDLEAIRARCERKRAVAKYELFARRLRSAP